MAAYLYAVMMELYRRGDGDKGKVRGDIVGYVVDLVNAMCGDVAKNWMRVDGYFALLYRLISGSKEFPELWALFFSRDFIPTLIDYVM